MPDLNDLRKSLTVRKVIRQVLVDSDLITDPKLGAGDYYEAYTVTTAEIILALNKLKAELEKTK